MRFVIAYDIANTKRRNKIANVLLNYGTRVQYSVFECRITKTQRIELGDKIDKIINSKQDIVSIYLQCNSCYSKKIKLGKDINIPFNKDIIIK